MPQTLFYATKGDLKAILAMAEGQGFVSYARYGSYDNDELEIYPSYVELPSLGVATADSSIASISFLVCRQETQFRGRRVTTDDGSRILLDQLANPDTITLTPGGLWTDGTLLHGRVASASDSTESVRLLKVFVSSIRRRCAKIHAFFVGPEAAELLRAGARLTMSVSASRDFDLSV